jgi:hypothetical protein
MTERKAFDLGAVAGFFLAVAGFSGNWLISPVNHPDASPVRRAAVIAQGLISLGIALYLYIRRPPRSSSELAV